MTLAANINRETVPKHIAIIMDGNGRWAQSQGQERLIGHHTGVESVREALKAAQEVGVKFLTLYAFSMENWNRPKKEVEGLMDLLVRTIAGEVDELDASNVRIHTIGDIDGLPNNCSDEMAAACERTRNNSGVNLVLALNYSAKWEILKGVKSIASEYAKGNINLDDITSEKIDQVLSTSGIPDPELIIRTSGEHRLSNFLLWQAAYAELHFTEVLWPDFKQDDFFRAILDYQSRERRFGKVSEQLGKDV